jgi:hypothetical protein
MRTPSARSFHVLYITSLPSVERTWYQTLGTGFRAGKPDEAANSLEALGTQPGEVSYRVTVTGAFTIKERS